MLKSKRDYVPDLESKSVPSCAFNDCSEQIICPMRGKYCKAHRQKVYKKTYLKKSHKLKEKYKESEECFSGSPDFFVGQDINEMLHQVLFKKRMELMGCPSVVEFLKTRQEIVRAKAREKIEKPVLGSDDKAPLNSSLPLTQGLNANSFIAKEFWMNQKIIPERFDRGLTPDLHDLNSPKTSFFKTEIEIFPHDLVQTSKKAIVKPEISPKMMCNNGEKPVMDVSIKTKKTKSSDSTNVNKPSIDLEIRSAFQETGAGDAKSLFAVRTGQLNGDKISS